VQHLTGRLSVVGMHSVALPPFIFIAILPPSQFVDVQTNRVSKLQPVDVATPDSNSAIVQRRAPAFIQTVAAPVHFLFDQHLSPVPLPGFSPVDECAQTLLIILLDHPRAAHVFGRTTGFETAFADGTGEGELAKLTCEQHRTGYELIASSQILFPFAFPFTTQYRPAPHDVLDQT